MTAFGLKTLHNQYYGEGNSPTHFQSLSNIFAANLVKRMSGLVWDSYDRCKPSLIKVFNNHHDLLQIERSITQILSDDIFRHFPAEAPFCFQQNRDEFASLKTSNAQPPQNDMAFYLSSDSRVSWPLEAKVLETPATIAEYIKDINDSFLTGKYAPYSDSAAMVGYLRKPDATTCKNALETNLKVPLTYYKKSHWTSDHKRSLPLAGSTIQDFRCHHFIFELY